MRSQENPTNALLGFTQGHAGSHQSIKGSSPCPENRSTRAWVPVTRQT